MEIDFHHGVVYVLARWAGFDSREADIIAYSSQYVDDAVCDDAVMFDNGAIYKPIRSAHKMLDYHYFDKLTNHFVWVPFHFLPANCMLPEGEGVDIEFALRTVCRPNSFIAKDMIDECVRQRDRDNSLQRLGITLHVYADTWAHQGFCGIQHKCNTIKYFEDDEVSKNLLNKLSNFFVDTFDKKLGKFVEGVLPLGHGAVLSYPDKPYLKWRYKDFEGNLVERNNTALFLEASDNIFMVLRRFKTGDPYENQSLGIERLEILKQLFEEINDEDCEKRHQRWLNKISAGELGFVSENISYSRVGEGAWEYEAFRGVKYNTCTGLEFSESFMDCDWKKFYDALQDHYYYLTRTVFPKYGLCVL